MSMYTVESFEEFWQVYREVHADPRVRKAHAVATTSAIVLGALAIARRSPWLAIAAPVVDHAIAQWSHRRTGIVTKPYKRAVWHLRAEWRLYRETLRDQLAA